MVKPGAKVETPVQPSKPEPPMSHPRVLYFTMSGPDRFFRSGCNSMFSYGTNFHESYTSALASCPQGWYVVRVVVTAAWHNESTPKPVPYQ